jgi:hypothetical protein
MAARVIDSRSVGTTQSGAPLDIDTTARAN